MMSGIVLTDLEHCGENCVLTNIS